jgi:putative transposase
MSHFPPPTPRFRRKNIRLRRAAYISKNLYFVTMCCAQRRSIFAQPAACFWFLDILRSESASHDFAVHAHSTMPDHVHLLVEGLQPSSDLLQFLRALKSKTSTPFERKYHGALWQSKFYDHILRANDSPDAVAWYIWMNPVRKGLCAKPQDYAFSGSFTGAFPPTAQPVANWHPPTQPNPNRSEQSQTDPRHP